MFHNQTVLYFASIRKTTAAFGTLFDSIKIRRYSDVGGQGTVLSTIDVPLSYGPAEKWIRRTKENPQNNKTKIRVSVPRITFELVNIEYDETRKLVTTTPTIKYSTTNPDAVIKQLNRVPYRFTYDVNILTKNIDDGLQIVEQILPNFAPSFNITVKELEQLNIVNDVPVIFNGITQSDEYMGQFEEDRVLIWTLSFTVNGHLYPNITDANVIKKVYANMYTDSQMPSDGKTEIVAVKVDPIDSLFSDDWNAKTGIYNGDTDFDTNGDPI